MEKLKIEYRPNYTYEDYIQWEGHWELIDGIPYAMTPSPNYRHQVISGNIDNYLRQQLENCKKCKPVMALDWRIKKSGDNNVLCPDNVVICYDMKGDFIEEPPILIFEILSPATHLKDKDLKYYIYQTQGVKYYVIVDIDLKKADVFELKNNQYVKIAETSDDSIDFDLGYCKVKFDFSRIWFVK